VIEAVEYAYFGSGSEFLIEVCHLCLYFSHILSSFMLENMVH
jgi:hypothetical protein